MCLQEASVSPLQYACRKLRCYFRSGLSGSSGFTFYSALPRSFGFTRYSALPESSGFAAPFHQHSVSADPVCLPDTRFHLLWPPQECHVSLALGQAPVSPTLGCRRSSLLPAPFHQHSVSADPVRLPARPVSPALGFSGSGLPPGPPRFTSTRFHLYSELSGSFGFTFHSAHPGGLGFTSTVHFRETSVSPVSPVQWAFRKLRLHLLRCASKKLRFHLYSTLSGSFGIISAVGFQEAPVSPFTVRFQEASVSPFTVHSQKAPVSPLQYTFRRR